MSDVEVYVTEWGFPAFRWRDRIATMKGNPLKPLPKVVDREIERALWVDRDGLRLLMLDHMGSEIKLGHWDELQSFLIGSTRDELSPEQTRLLGMQRLVWVEHQTLRASFKGNRVERVAVSAVPASEMQGMLDVIARELVDRRQNYVAPDEGTCWRKSFLPEMKDLEAGETSGTRLDAANAPARGIVATDGGAVARVDWKEPVAASQWGGWSKPRRYVVARKLFAARGYRPRTWRLCFRSYRPGAAGVVEVNADLAFLKDFRVAHAGEVDAGPFQPLEGLAPGVSVVADFRYGLSLPLTSALVADAAGRKSVEDLRDVLRRKFIPLAGQRLTEEQLGG